jgi:hypothetical protein
VYAGVGADIIVPPAVTVIHFGIAAGIAVCTLHYTHNVREYRITRALAAQHAGAAA